MDSSETSYSSPLPVAVATTPTMSLTLSQTGYADTNWHEVEARLQNATSLAERTRTYGGRWPRESPLDPVELARAGFIYVGPGVAVQCVLCGLKIEKWLPGDSALGAHLASKPQCLFVADVYRSDSNKGTMETSSDDSSPAASTMAMTSWQSQYRLAARLQNITSADERKRSFEGRWPKDSPLDPVDLAQAGFSLGPDSAVRCVYCGLQLMVDKWVSGDSVLGAHLASNPACPSVADVYRDDRAIDEAMVEPFSDRNANKASSAHLTEYEALAAENAQLKAARQCRVCRENETDTVFVPCGHLATCNECAADVDQCPICDSIVKASVRTFR